MLSVMKQSSVDKKPSPLMVCGNRITLARPRSRIRDSSNKKQSNRERVSREKAQKEAEAKPSHHPLFQARAALARYSPAPVVPRELHFFSEAVALGEFSTFYGEVCGNARSKPWEFFIDREMSEMSEKTADLKYKILSSRAVQRFDSGLAESTEAVAVFRTDESGFSGQRVIVEQLAGSTLENVAKLVGLLESFLLEELRPPADEIFLRLSHRKSAEDLLPPPARLVDALKERGFKWKFVENGDDGNRVTVMAKSFTSPDARKCLSDLRLTAVLAYGPASRTQRPAGPPPGGLEPLERHFFSARPGSSLPALPEDFALRDFIEPTRLGSAGQLETQLETTFGDSRDRPVKKVKPFDSPGVSYLLKLAMRVPQLAHCSQILHKRLTRLLRLPCVFTLEDQATKSEVFICDSADPSFKFLVVKPGSRDLSFDDAAIKSLEAKLNSAHLANPTSETGFLWIPQFSKSIPLSNYPVSDPSAQALLRLELSLKRPATSSDLSIEPALKDKKIKADFHFGILHVDLDAMKVETLYSTSIQKNDFVFST